MTNTQQSSTAWDEDRIVDSIQAKSTDEPRIDVYNQVEWVTDDVAIGLAMEVYKDMRAEIAALQAQLAEAQAGSWMPLSDGEYTMQGWSDTYTLNVCFDGAELAAWSNADKNQFKDGSPIRVDEMGVGDYRLCALQPAAQAGLEPVPDGPIGPGISLRNRVIWFECHNSGILHGYALQDGEMLMRAQRAPEPAAPEQAGGG